MYSVDESSGQVELVLILSNPSSIDFDLMVTNDIGTSFGRLPQNCSYYFMLNTGLQLFPFWMRQSVNHSIFR